MVKQPQQTGTEELSASIRKSCKLWLWEGINSGSIGMSFNFSRLSEWWQLSLSHHWNCSPSFCKSREISYYLLFSNIIIDWVNFYHWWMAKSFSVLHSPWDAQHKLLPGPGWAGCTWGRQSPEVVGCNSWNPPQTPGQPCFDCSASLTLPSTF